MRTRSWIVGLISLSACASGGEAVVVGTDTGSGLDAQEASAKADAQDTGSASEVSTPEDGGADVVMDAGAACRGDDDCRGPDLCSNAQRCRFGRCEVVGGPAGCDDMVACTDDSCDPMRGQCVHAPNDMRCTGGEFCGGSVGCVREVPCELADATCARLSGDPCTGTWSCSGARRVCVRSAPFDCNDMDPCTTDICVLSGTAPRCTHTGPEYQTDAMNCGRCMNRCTPGAHQTSVCAMGMCANACEMGYVDLDRSAANGCECHSTDPDAPDLEFRDTNCDGIDGNASQAIFVSPRGDDANPGTMALPLRTLAAAITAAAAATPHKQVFASLGTYTGTVRLASGVSVYGGYNDTEHWNRAASNTTLIQGDTTTGVFGQSLTGDLELQLLVITARDATTAGESSYGVRLVASSARVTLRSCRIQAGTGASGVDGTDGHAGTAGGNGGNASGGSPGGAGASSCGAAGGTGGTGTRGNGRIGSQPNGAPGSNGVMASGGAGGIGGSAGSGGGGCGNSRRGGNAPDNAGTGYPGAAGTNGDAGGSGLVRTADGVYVASSATGGTAGRPGGGGGGGGSGGADSAISGFSCRASTSGGGGGGGAGGCGGTPGVGGGSGGGSFAVLSAGANLLLESCQINVGRGGAGGAGGDGGAGGFAGDRGGGAGGENTSGAGARGAPGGAGGQGGAGGGGAGGPSVCVQYLGGAPSITGMTCGRGGGGAGGRGGAGVGGMAPSGPTGFSDDVRAGS